MTWKRARFLAPLGVLGVLMWLGEIAHAQDGAGAATAEKAAPAQDAAPTPTPPPNYKIIRAEEDWSKFDPSTSDDFWAPIKHVKLSKDGSVWASFGGELRARVENWQNFGFADDNDDTFLLGRILAHMDLHFGENVRVYVEGKSALSTPRDLPGHQRTLDVDELALQGAFVDLRFPSDGVTFTLRVGRQELLFGKQRLVSPLPWSNSMRTWDAARAILEFDRWRIDGFWSRYVGIKKYEFNDWELGSDFYGVYATGKVGDRDKPFDVDAYFLGLNQSSATYNGTAGDEERYTFGARFGGTLGDFDFDLESAYQFGQVGSGDVNAWMIAADAGYTFACPWKPHLNLGFDYASGDDAPGDDEVQTFNQLFPLGHAYFGYMDFIGRQNIIDLHSGLSFKPWEALTVKVDGHLFWRASTDDALYNAGGGVVRAGNLSNESEVGQEIDLTLIYAVDKHLTLQGGYSHFFPGSFIDDSGPGRQMDWFYFQATYRF